MPDEPVVTESDSGPPTGPFTRWPPPGLERLQGDLTRVAARAGFGGAVLALPILFVAARDLDFATLGPFADAWWVPVVLATIGLAFATDALIRAMTLLRRVAEALGRGYDATTIRFVLADSGRDMGFLLTGARHFSTLDEREREALGAVRVFSVTMYAIAGIWLPNALAVGLLLGARGVLSPSGLWMLALLPSVALYVFGAVAGESAESRVRRARRNWHRSSWSSDLESDEAQEWRASFAAAGGPEDELKPRDSYARLLRHGSILLVALAGLVAVPILTLVPVSVVGPILTEMATPAAGTARERAALAEAFRGYVLPSDPSMSPAEAGDLLHVIYNVGTDEELSLGVREPVRRVEQPWLSDVGVANPTGVDPVDWPDSLFSIVAKGVSSEQRGYLEGLASHPAREDFSRLARAAAIDIASARFVDPLPDEMTMNDLPLPQVSALRAAADSHLGAAAFELLEGHERRAEQMIQEVVSVGFLIGDGAPGLVDNLLGYALASDAGTALEHFYEVTGRDADAGELRTARTVAERAESRSRFEYPQGSEAWIRSLPSVVEDTTIVRGLRWEFFVAITSLTPCINLSRMVFGPDQAYRDFLERAHDSLVEWPSEEGLFELARGGFFGSVAGADRSWLGRLLSVSMRKGESSCGDVVSNLTTVGAIF